MFGSIELSFDVCSVCCRFLGGRGGNLWLFGSAAIVLAGVLGWELLWRAAIIHARSNLYRLLLRRTTAFDAWFLFVWFLFWRATPIVARSSWSLRGSNLDGSTRHNRPSATLAAAMRSSPLFPPLEEIVRARFRACSAAGIDRGTRGRRNGFLRASSSFNRGSRACLAARFEAASKKRSADTSQSLESRTVSFASRASVLSAGFSFSCAAALDAGLGACYFYSSQSPCERTALGRLLYGTNRWSCCFRLWSGTLEGRDDRGMRCRSKERVYSRSKAEPRSCRS